MWETPSLSIGYEVFNFALCTFMCMCLCDPDVLVFAKSVDNQESIKYLKYLGVLSLSSKPIQDEMIHYELRLIKFGGITPCLLLTH